MNRPLRSGLLMAAIAVIAAPKIAHAYVDPGSAGSIITSVLGFLAAGGYIVRRYLYRLKRLIFRSAGKAAESEVSDTADVRADDRQSQG